MSVQPGYHDFTDMDGAERFALAEAFARQILTTVSPWLPKPPEELDVLDLGSGYGDTAAELAKVCGTVVGLEPTSRLVETARQEHAAVSNLTFRHAGVEGLTEEDAYDLIVLDNVYEHLPDHALAMKNIVRALRPGGVLYLLTPNRLWPVEAHYRLPFLSWLPLPLANAYLRLTRRGVDYSDASYAPTYWSLIRDLRREWYLDFSFMLPGDPEAVRGGGWHYRIGMRLLLRFPSLWAISKSLLVVAINHPRLDKPRFIPRKR